MSSGEDPSTWTYFDLPVEDKPVMGRGQPHYMNANGVQQMRPHVKGDKWTEPPYADMDVIEQLSRVVKRKRKVGLTTNVNSGDINDWSEGHVHPTFVPERSQLHRDRDRK